jgi:lipooligosaccharide transport system ATP-binding protein
MRQSISPAAAAGCNEKYAGKKARKKAGRKSAARTAGGRKDLIRLFEAILSYTTLRGGCQFTVSPRGPGACYNIHPMYIVTAKALRKDYDSLRAVDGIDFGILKGECFGFLGPNGAGKTTAMQIIHCYMPPTSGEVRVFGMDVRESPERIKSRIGVMPQDDNLDPDLSVLENLVVYARYFDIPKREALRAAWELLDFVELRGKARVNIRSLSGGMKRRLLLARALINNPEMLILDEPTTGLDPHSRHSVWEKLNHLKSSKQTTLVLTTHYMEEAQRLCDRVAIMDAGRIVAVDTPEGLMRAHGGSLEDVYLRLTGRPLEA